MSVVNRAARPWTQLLVDPSLSDKHAAQPPGSAFKPDPGLFADLTPGQPEEATHIYAGTFTLLGETHSAVGGRPFRHPFPVAPNAPKPSEIWILCFIYVDYQQFTKI